MRNVCKLIVAGTMLLAGAFVSQAQPGRQGGQGGQRFDPAQMAQRRADMMKETLKLTDKQYEEVLAMYKEESAQMQGGQPQQGMDREQMQKQREERRAAQDAKLKKILTDEQYKTWTEQQNRRGQGGPGGPGGPGGRGGRPGGQGGPGPR